MKVCILGATFDTANMGISMLAAGGIRCVARRFPHARIILCDYAHEGNEFQFSYDGRRIPIQLVNIRFSKKVYLKNNIAFLIVLALLYRMTPLKSLRGRLLQWNRYLKEVVEADLVVSLAYGDSFSDIYGMERLLYVSLPQVFVLVAGKRLVFLPQTIGPFKSRLGKSIAKHILKHTEIIYSRDNLSLESARVLLGFIENNGKLRFCPDLAFDVDAAPPARLDIEGLSATPDNRSCLVGFNVSGLLMVGGYTQDNMFGLKMPYDKLVYRLIKLFIEEKSASVLLIPHVLGSPDELESDSRACQTVFERLRYQYEGKLGVMRGSYKHDEIKYVIGQCDFFVGARMHACIGAISQNVPTVPIAYSNKFAGMMQAIGFEDLVADPRRMSEDDIVQLIDQVYERRLIVRRDFEVKIPMVKQGIHEALADLGMVNQDPG